MEVQRILQETLPTLMHEAVMTAQRQNRNILMSLTLSIPWCNMLSAFSLQQTYASTSFFWEHAPTQRVLMGIGESAFIQVDGPDRFLAAENYWNELLVDAIIREVHVIPTLQNHISGPLFCGGFAFDPHGGSSSLWNGFAGGWMVLPSIMLSGYHNYMTLTINQVVQPKMESKLKAVECIQSVIQLLSSLSSTQHVSFTTCERTLLTRSDKQFLSTEEWKRAVTRTVEYIQQGICNKVVLARGVKVTLHPPTEIFDVQAILSHLREHYPTAYLFSLRRGKQSFCGATPEQLARTQNGYVHTMALAGSSPRGTTKLEDQILGTQLLHNKKNLEEHAFVVTMIYETLRSICSSVEFEKVPRLLQLKNIQHLMTPVIGKLLPARSILDVVAALHPTPAVGGTPRQEALAVIHQEEQLDRGWYASPIGWLDSRGNGEFAIALRSALVNQQSAVLFAGCGIVSDSKAEEEYQETCWKLQVMMESLRSVTKDV